MFCFKVYLIKKIIVDINPWFASLLALGTASADLAHFGMLSYIFPNTITPSLELRTGSSASDSPTPPDFFLWGYLKEKVYVDKPSTIAELMDKIQQACAELPMEI